MNFGVANECSVMYYLLKDINKGIPTYIQQDQLTTWLFALCY
jgi:hypothetical protein